MFNLVNPKCPECGEIPNIGVLDDGWMRQAVHQQNGCKFSGHAFRFIRPMRNLKKRTHKRRELAMKGLIGFILLMVLFVICIMSNQLTAIFAAAGIWLLWKALDFRG